MRRSYTNFVFYVDSSRFAHSQLEWPCLFFKSMHLGSRTYYPTPLPHLTDFICTQITGKIKFSAAAPPGLPVLRVTDYYTPSFWFRKNSVCLRKENCQCLGRRAYIQLRSVFPLTPKLCLMKACAPHLMKSTLSLTLVLFFTENTPFYFFQHKRNIKQTTSVLSTIPSNFTGPNIQLHFCREHLQICRATPISDPIDIL